MCGFCSLLQRYIIAQDGSITMSLQGKESDSEDDVYALTPDPEKSYTTNSISFYGTFERSFTLTRKHI